MQDCPIELASGCISGRDDGRSPCWFFLLSCRYVRKRMNVQMGHGCTCVCVRVCVGLAGEGEAGSRYDFMVGTS